MISRRRKRTALCQKCSSPGSHSTEFSCAPKARLQHSGTAVDPHYNLPPEQRATQQLVDRFYADERLWKNLEPRGRARRKLRPRRSRKKLKKLDVQEFAKVTPLHDCIGQWVELFGLPS